jgi:chromosome segregation ATPase
LTKQELDIAKRQASEVVSRNEGLEEENKQLRTASEALEAVGEDNVRLENKLDIANEENERMSNVLALANRLSTRTSLNLHARIDFEQRRAVEESTRVDGETQALRSQLQASHDEFERVSRELNTTKGELRVAQDIAQRLEEAEEEAAKKRARELAESDKQLTHLRDEVDRLGTALGTTKEELRNAKDIAKALEEAEKAVTTTRDGLVDELRGLSIQFRDSENEVSRLNTVIDTTNEELRVANDKARALEEAEKAVTQQRTDDLRESNSQLQSSMNEVHHLNAALSTTNQELRVARDRAQELEQMISILAEALDNSDELTKSYKTSRTAFARLLMVQFQKTLAMKSLLTHRRLLSQAVLESAFRFLEAYRHSLAERFIKCARQERAAEASNQKRQMLQGDVSNLEARLMDKENGIQRRDTDIADLEARVNQQTRNYNTLLSEKNNCDTSLGQVTEENLRLRSSRSNLRTRLSALQQVSNDIANAELTELHLRVAALGKCHRNLVVSLYTEIYGSSIDRAKSDLWFGGESCDTYAPLDQINGFNNKDISNIASSFSELRLTQYRAVAELHKSEEVINVLAAEKRNLVEENTASGDIAEALFNSYEAYRDEQETEKMALGEQVKEYQEQIRKLLGHVKNRWGI